VLDSYLVSDVVDVEPLPPVGQRERRVSPRTVAKAREALRREIASASRGKPYRQVRLTESGERVVSVSLPIRHVKAVLGVLTLEAGDFEEIVAAQRRALIPFILVAIVVSLLSSLLLARFIAHPIERLSHAADRVRLSRSRAISLPTLAQRDDEIGDLTRSLEAMTDALSERIDAIEAFAADVAHEIRNPLTSIRSAVETLDLVRDEAPRRRLLDILNQDVQRLDRLITDISNASRLDAELSRHTPQPLDLDRFLYDLVTLSRDVRRAGEPEVGYEGVGESLFVTAREGPLGQVFRNLVDNAKSFSPPGAEVQVRLRREAGEAIAAVDDEGPGIPAENLETVFQRFYTSRPKGAAFGGNSGLGLSIARQIVEAHGGRVWAENRTDEEGQVLGARFQVALPEAAEETGR
jgi:two-component system sensor histidine kinase ChvG